jgi:hypothetical protein
MNMNIHFKNFLFFITLIISGHSSNIVAKTTSLHNTGGDPDIEKRVMTLPSQIELRYNSQVKEQIEFFVEKNKKLSRTLLGRATMFFPMIEEQLQKNQMPDELKYLTVIESALVPYLTSGAGASGLWQFMKPTAENLGLKISSTVDERKNPEKSTEAAIAYLKKLYSIYKDWTLVLAAYNCGDGVVNRVLKNNKSRSYWDIQSDLPHQTQEFVPKFIAVAYLMNYYYKHDLTPDPMPDDYLYTASIKVYDKIDLDELASQYGIDDEVMRRLNPAFIKGFIPKSDGEYVLTLPESRAIDYAMNNNAYELIVAYSKPSLDRKQIHFANTDAQPAIVEAQREKTDPVGELPMSSLFISNKLEAIRLEDEINVKIVKLTKGKSLQDIANENGVELASLIEYNKIRDDYPPQIGDQIRIKI